MSAPVAFLSTDAAGREQTITSATHWPSRGLVAGVVTMLGAAG